MTEVAKQCWVSGRVQGVFFRESTRREAERLGLRGEAVNLSDGRVSVVVAGDSVPVKQLITWLHQGPRTAKVDTVVVEDHSGAVPQGFRTG
ncbi:MAG: acylphosphatase [Pseudomonadota bacterium]